MRNGTRSNKLTLVNGNAQATPDDAGTPPATLADRRGSNPVSVSPTLVLFTVSAACGTAAVVAGSYAFWLSRQQAARQTLTDVQDILKRCQERMHQMEDDLNHLPSGLTSLLS